VSRTHLKEHELRAVIRAALNEAAPSADVESSAVDMMGDLVKRTSGFSPATRLQLINKLTGVDKTGWWNDVLEKCSIDNVIKVKASGGRTWSGNDSTLYSRQPAQFLNGFLNFCISSIMSGKDVQLSSISTPKAGAIDQTLTLSANKFFDVIVSDDGTTAYVYPALPALVDQCRTYFSTENVKTFEDLDFALVLQNETFLQKVIKTELPARDPDASTGQNLCWTYVPERKQAEIRSGIEAANAQAVEGLQAVLDKTDDEVYEAYLYTPLLMPQVWKNPDLPPESPLYTPWRMTYAACNLMADIMINHGDLGKYAVLSHIFRLADRGTQLNIFDAPGMDYAVGKSESLNEAHLIVKGMFLTETDLRRVIRAALEYNILNEGIVPDPVDVLRGVGKLATGAAELGGEAGAAVVKAASEAGEASLTVTQKMSDFIQGVKTGSYIESVTSRLNLFSKIPEDIKSATAIQALLKKIHKVVLANAGPGIGLPGPGGSPTAFDAISRRIADEIVTTMELADGNPIDTADAQKIADAFRALLSSIVKRSGTGTALDADVAFKAATDGLSQNAVLAIRTKIEEFKRVLQDPIILEDVSDIFIPRAVVDAMKDNAAAALQTVLERSYGTVAVKIESVPLAGGGKKITLKVPRPTAIVGTSAANKSVTIDPADLVDIDTVPSILASFRGNITTERATELYQTAVTGRTGVTNLPAYKQAAASLNDGNEYERLRRQISTDFLNAAADALPTALGNGQIRGVVQMPAAPRTDMAKFFIDNVVDPVGNLIPKLNPFDPTQGVIPFIDLPADKITDVNGQMIRSASLTRDAWKSFKSSASVAAGAPSIPGGAAPTKLERGRAGGIATLKFIGALAATALDFSSMVSRGTTLGGMKGLERVGRRLSTSKSAIPRGAGAGMMGLVKRPWLGRVAGGAVGHGVAAGAVTAIGFIGSDIFTPDKQQQSSAGVNIAKTLVVDFFKSPVTFTNRGVTFFAGGPLRFVADIVVGVYEDNTTEIKDFNAMMEALSPDGDTAAPTARLDKANEVLTNLFSNLLKNAFTTSDVQHFSKFFPELVSSDLTTAMIPREVRQEAYTMMQSVIEGTKAAISTLPVVGGEYKSPAERAKAARTAATAAAERIRTRLETFESQKAGLGISYGEASSETLTGLESSRSSVVAVTVKGIKDASTATGAASIASSIKQYQTLLVNDTYGRGGDESEEVLRGQYSDISQFLFDSSEYFDVLTSYYETSAGDSATSLAAAVGPLGLEFSGDLDDAQTKKIMADLSVAWSTSGAAVAGLLSAMADLEKTE
jgi:hypothetical protein